jgi:hypothetical protein
MMWRLNGVALPARVSLYANLHILGTSSQWSTILPMTSERRGNSIMEKCQSEERERVFNAMRLSTCKLCVRLCQMRGRVQASSKIATPVMMRKLRQRSARLKTLSLCFGMTQGGHLEEPPILTRRRPSDPDG